MTVCSLSQNESIPEQQKLIYQKFLNDMPDALVICNRQNLIQLFNQQIEQMFGYDKEYLQGKKFSALLTDKFCDFYKHEIEKSEVSTIEKTVYKLEGKRKDGTIFPLNVSIKHSQLFQEGATTFSLHDMTEYHSHEKSEERLSKLMDKTKEENQRLYCTIFNALHNIRNPLHNCIIGKEYLKDSLDTFTSDLEKSLLSDFLENTEEICQILNNLLTVDKLRSGKLCLETIHFSLRLVLESTVKQIAHFSNAKKMNVIIDTPPNSPDLFIGDPERLMQILLNFIISTARNSAVKRELRIQTVIQELKDSKVEITFNILEIPAEVHQKEQIAKLQSGLQVLKEPLKKDDLHLHFVYELLTFMKSFIQIAKTEEGSQLFTFTICLVKPKAESTPAILAHPDFKSVFKGIKILIVDDSNINYKLQNRLFQKFGAEKSDSAVCKSEAVKLAKENKYDIIFMDIEMPKEQELQSCQQQQLANANICDQEGFQAVRLIREDEKTLGRHVPIIICSASDYSVKNVLECGADDFIPKPFNIVSLVTIYNKHLRKNIENKQ